jgi:hypothetical protein
MKQLELVLDLHLEVVHVPGHHMIAQQTGGLSRGLAFSNGRLSRPPQEEVLRLFVGVQCTMDTLAWVESRYRSGRYGRGLTFCQSIGTWTVHDVIGRSTMWAPSPEWANQLINAVVESWIEQPWTTEAYFLVPRIFQRRWGRVTKHIIELDVIEPQLIPGGGDGDIPIVLLHLPCFVCLLPPPRLDRTPKPHVAKWHVEQAEHVRGL